MYEYIDASHLCDHRLYEARAGVPLGVLLHTTDGKNSQAYLQGGSIAAGNPASADFLITRNHKVVRLVPIGSMAYHAGVCRWDGKLDRGNVTSRLLVGIEIENYDRGGEAPTIGQHKCVAAVLLVFAATYPHEALRVYGHYGVAYPMGRRSDPHGLDWGYIFWLMAHHPEECKLTSAHLF